MGAIPGSRWLTGALPDGVTHDARFVKANGDGWRYAEPARSGARSWSRKRICVESVGNMEGNIK